MSAVAGNAANLVSTTPDTADNTSLNSYRFAGQAPAAGGGSDVEITVGGTSAIASLANPAAPVPADVAAINAQLQAQGITTVTAVLDQANTISFQGTANFSISDDHLAAGSYVLDGNSAVATQNGVDRLTAPQQATRQINLGDSVSIGVDQTAQTIFDHRNTDDSLAPDNVFAALNSLRVALLNNDTAGISAAQTSLDTASQYLNTQDVFYGATENRLSAAVSQIDSQNTSLQQQISAMRDTDVAKAAETLTAAETQDQAALAAEAKFPRTNLFDYLG